ncbi:DUF4244 domain-containing protein [Aeromicrobium sp. HA]|uniref:DUF4244 domain-containing protein n=1 Tax=Aeromicrobium sp. HA TaxID=3009077 RepID=UPI0022AFF7C9|nr:DUF4244 domain-containing protein [Aeromicrobium sp. HA]
MKKLSRAEQGQVTAEYAVGGVAAVTVAGAILGGPGSVMGRWVLDLVTDLVARAFTTTLPDLFRWPW